MVSLSQLKSNNELEFKDNSYEDIISLYLSNKITENQVKGMCLEISTYIALTNLGIFPIPLHNPFNEKYVLDNHLSIDLIFYHDYKLYGIECKNISSKWTISKDWIDIEITKRFDKLKDIIPIDVKIVLTSLHKDIMLRYLSKDYEVLEIGYQIYPETIGRTIFPIEQLISSLFSLKKLGYSVDTVHGYNEPKASYEKLRYIQTKLKELYEDTKED